MKLKVLFFLIVSLFFYSCSTDKEESLEEATNEIIGSWQLVELMIDNAATDKAEFGKAILDHLESKDCAVFSFTFKEDLSVVVEDAVNNLKVNVGVIGLDIPCPTEFNSNTSTYEYDGEVLTFVDENGETIDVDAIINEDILTIDAVGLNIPNFNESGILVFTKQKQ